MDAAALRSLLFVPGDREDMILKALASAADAVIIDLEDSVPPARKAAARDVTRGVLQGADRRGKALLVRLNAFDTGLTAGDAAAVVLGRPDGVMLPKAQGAASVLHLSHILEGLEAREGLDPGNIRITAVATETAAATLALSAPQGSGLDRLSGMLWGGEDLSAALGASANRDAAGDYTFAFQFARSQCLFAANALGVAAIDAVFADFRDMVGLERESRAALRDGFVAKTAIHPAQCDIINRVLTPAQADLDWASQVVSLLADRGVAQMDGRMVDIAHKRIALRLLARADALGRRQA